MNQPELYTLIGEATASLATYYPQMGPMIQQVGLRDVFYPIFMTRAAEPEAFSVEEFHGRVPYAARERQEKTMQAAAAAGFAVEEAPGAYRLTETGRAAIERVFAVAHDDLTQHAPLPGADLERLATLLQRLVDASLAGPEPAHKRALRHSRWTDPDAGAAPLVRIDQYLTDLVAYRDDAHLAAWQAHGVTGEAWEALTMLWRDQAHSAAELAEKLPFRSHTAEAYAQALADLAARDWVEVDSAMLGAFRITELGRTRREEGEVATNRLYFAPWQVLADGEREELIALLGRLRDAARAAQAAREAQAAPA